MADLSLNIPEQVRKTVLDFIQKEQNLRDIFIADDTSPVVSGASVSQSTRLLLMLRGVRYLTFSQSQEIRTCQLHKGDLIFLPPKSWVLARDEEAYEMCTFIIHPHHLRMIYRPYGQHHLQADDLYWHHSPSSPSHLLKLTEQMILEQLKTDVPREEICRALYLLSLNCAREVLRQPHALTSKSEASFRSMCAWLEERFRENIDRTDLAKVFSVTPNHVTKCFREHGQRTFSEHLTFLRLHCAEQMLLDKSLGIKEIAEQCGGLSSHRLIRLFKVQYGLTPGEYRKLSQM